MALTYTAIRNAKTAGKAVKLSNGEGLKLWITPRGSKLWRLAYRLPHARSRDVEGHPDRRGDNGGLVVRALS